MIPPSAVAKENAVSAAHQLGDASIPVHREMNIRIKSTVRIPEDRKDKIVIRRAARNTQTRKAEVQGDWISAKFDDFGVFQAFVDTEPPTINNLGNADTVNLSPVSRILFTPSDNFAVKSFRAELNGEWLRFTNDKGRNWIYVFDERVPYGTYKLEVTVVDLVGNSTTKSWWFKRGPYTPPKKKFVSKKSKKKSSGKKTAAKKKKSTKRK